MARRPARRHDEQEDDGDDDPEDSRAEAGPVRSRTGASRGVRPWASGRRSAAAEEDDEEGEDDAPESPRRFGFLHRGREPVYWRARDSLFFEPLVALAIIVVLLAGLFAYTQNWPPMYVVESQSMQHGYVDQLGLINTGDLVLAQKIDPTQIVPYMTGLTTGYQTYGEFGDVILYHPNGAAGTPIIHRALLWVEANPDGTYSVPGLNGLPCGAASGADYRTATLNGCDTSHIGGTLTLLHVGWRSVSVSVTLDTVGSSSGFLTMGDNNFDPSDPTAGIPDEPGLTSLVEQSWVVGVARGMLPWFGAVKLLLEGNANEVPPQSWQFLGITIVVLVLLAFGLHYVATSASRRDGDSDDEGDDDEADEPEKPGRLGGLRLWRSRSDEPDEDGDDDEGTKGPSAETSRAIGRGRPRPTVKKGSKGAGRRSPSDDSDSQL